MFGSIKLGSIFGIAVRVHVLLLALGGLLFLDQGPRGALGFAILFLVVLLHELGHSVVAQRMGVQVVDITLWPLGGMARMNAMPESSRVEGWIAIAGPAVNFALAALATVALFAGLTMNAPLWLSDALAQFLQVNLALGIFNLVPAFPTDGGRILRAWLARERGQRGQRAQRAQRDWLRATEIAVRVGGYAAFLLTVCGCVLLFSSPAFVPQGVALLLIAAFLWWTGKKELFAVRLRHGGGPFEALAELLRRGAARNAPGVAREGEAPRSAGAPAASETGGFSEAQIRELERFHGRLGSWPPRREP